MRLLAPVVAAATVAASLLFVSQMSANAAASATSCSSNEKQGGVNEHQLQVKITRAVISINPEEITSYIQLWYSPTCRYVWAVEGGQQLGGDHIWIFNQNTGVSANAYSPNTSTAAINDAGDLSHACIENTGSYPVSKTCTGWF
jgi:hypothetical protein